MDGRARTPMAFHLLPPSSFPLPSDAILRYLRDIRLARPDVLRILAGSALGSEVLSSQTDATSLRAFNLRESPRSVSYRRDEGGQGWDEKAAPSTLKDALRLYREAGRHERTVTPMPVQQLPVSSVLQTCTVPGTRCTWAKTSQHFNAFDLKIMSKTQEF